MHSNGHVRFGGRAGETGREQSRNRASARPYWHIQRHRKRGTIRRYCGGGWWPVTAETALFNPTAMRTTRYRYRGAAIPALWPASG
jgi:hypothetical protein